MDGSGKPSKAKLSRSHVDDALKIEKKTQTESGDRPEEKTSDVGSNKIYRYFPKC